MSQQHPANVPTTVANLTEPTADALLDDLRSALEAADWTPQDRLTIGTNGGLDVECQCDCGTVTAVTGRVVQHSRPIAELAAAATNALPALVERLATGREQDAEVIASLSNTVLAVAGELGVTSVTGSTEILRTLRRALHDGVAAQARAERLQRELDEAGKRIDELTADRERAADLIAALNREPERAGKLADIRATATEWVGRRSSDADSAAAFAVLRASGRRILSILDAEVK